MIRERDIPTRGLRFRVLEAGPEDGPLALCMHGYPDTAHTWDALLPRLAEAGYRAVAPWMRGYPPTEVPANGDFSVVALGGDVLDLLDALKADRATLIGHDWGTASVRARDLCSGVGSGMGTASPCAGVWPMLASY